MNVRLLLRATPVLSRTLLAALSLALAACAVDRTRDGWDGAESDLASSDDGARSPRSPEEGASSATSRARTGRVRLESPNGPIDFTYRLEGGRALAEGDVLVPTQTTSATRIGRRWSGAVVPYVIDPDLPEPERVTDAIAHWESQTNLRFVARTTQVDYLSFEPSTGCASWIGRWGGKQGVDLSTGEGAWNVVAVGIDRATDRAYYFYRRGFATAGTTTRADEHRSHFRYALPVGKTPDDLVDVAFTASGHVVAWYLDGTVSEGTPSDLGAHAAPAAYTLAAGKVPKDVAAFAVDGAGQAHAFYKDGTFSVGTTTTLDATSARATYAIAASKSLWSLAHVDVDASGAFHAFYSDGRTSSGTAADLAAANAGALARVSFPGHCSTGSTIHEIGHAVGLFHEQSRQDRDQFVTIQWANIPQPNQHNFDKYAIATGNDTGPYDYASIMHYDSYAFSSNGQPTIVKTDGSIIVANRTALSPGDVAAAAFMYPAPPTP